MRLVRMLWVHRGGAATQTWSSGEGVLDDSHCGRVKPLLSIVSDAVINIFVNESLSILQIISIGQNPKY